MAEDIVAKLADGTELHFPAGTSDAVVDKVVKSHITSSTPQEPYKMSDEQKANISDLISSQKPSLESAKAFPAEKTFAEEYPLTTGYGVGLAKPIAGVMQWLGANKPAQFLKEKEEEAKSTGRAGVGAAEFGGEMAGLLTGSRFLPKIKTLPSSVTQALEKSPFLSSAATGAATSAVMPTEMKEGEDYPAFLKSKAEDIGAGTLFGGVAGKATQALMNPQVGEKVKKLIASGQEYFTPGQLFSETPIIGKMLQRGEQALTSTPLAGSLISSSMQKSVENFNRNIANKVLQPLGEKLEKGMKAGHEMIDFVHNKVANAYDDIAPNLTFDATHKVDGQSTIKTLTDKLKDVTDTLTPEDEVKVANAFNKFIINPLQENLSLSGESFRAAESKLGKAAYDAFKKGDYNISNAYRDLQEELRQQLANQNPKYAQKLSNIHESFKRYLRLERAGSYRGAEEGVFTPHHFRAAVESIAGKKQTARGKALMQDEAKVAEDVLGRKVPDSGTAERFLSSLLLKKLGTGAVEGAANVLTGGLPLVLSGAVYNPLSQRALVKLATERPEIVRKIAPALQSITSRAAAIPREEEDNKPIGGLNLTTP